MESKQLSGNANEKDVHFIDTSPKSDEHGFEVHKSKKKTHLALNEDLKRMPKLSLQCGNEHHPSINRGIQSTLKQEVCFTPELEMNRSKAIKSSRFVQPKDNYDSVSSLICKTINCKGESVKINDSIVNDKLVLTCYPSKRYKSTFPESERNRLLEESSDDEIIQPCSVIPTLNKIEPSSSPINECASVSSLICKVINREGESVRVNDQLITGKIILSCEPRCYRHLTHTSTEVAPVSKFSDIKQQERTGTLFINKTTCVQQSIKHQETPGSSFTYKPTHVQQPKEHEEGAGSSFSYKPTHVQQPKEHEEGAVSSFSCKPNRLQQLRRPKEGLQQQSETPSFNKIKQSSSPTDESGRVASLICKVINREGESVRVNDQIITGKIILCCEPCDRHLIQTLKEDDQDSTCTDRNQQEGTVTLFINKTSHVQQSMEHQLGADASFSYKPTLVQQPRIQHEDVGTLFIDEVTQVKQPIEHQQPRIQHKDVGTLFIDEVTQVKLPIEHQQPKIQHKDAGTLFIDEVTQVKQPIEHQQPRIQHKDVGTSFIDEVTQVKQPIEHQQPRIQHKDVGTSFIDEVTQVKLPIEHQDDAGTLHTHNTTGVPQHRTQLEGSGTLFIDETTYTAYQRAVECSIRRETNTSHQQSGDMEEYHYKQTKEIEFEEWDKINKCKKYQKDFICCYWAFIIINILFLELAGIAVFIVTWTHLMFKDYINIVIAQRGFVTWMWIAFVISQVIIFIAVFGIFSLTFRRIKHWCLLLYCILAVFVANLILLGLLVFWFNFTSLESTTYKLMEYTKSMYRCVLLIHNAWDTLQETHKCCGIDSVDNWKFIPPSCCKADTKSEKVDCIKYFIQKSQAHNEGCKSKLEDYFVSNFLLLTILLLLVIFILISGVVVAWRLLRLHKRLIACKEILRKKHKTTIRNKRL